MTNTQISHQKKVAVVSGAFGYLGKEIVAELALAGWRVAMLYRSNNQEERDAFIGSLVGSGHKSYMCDLGNKVAVENVFLQIEQELGVIDVCVHAAGEKGKRKKLLQTGEEELREQLESNVMSGFHFLKKGAQVLKDNKGGTLIGITTSSISNDSDAPSLGGYVPAKFALHGMLAMLRSECSPFEVCVYSVTPGFMEGGMNADIPKAFIDLMKTKTKSGGLLTPKKVATTIVSLCNKDNKESPLTISVIEE